MHFLVEQLYYCQFCCYCHCICSPSEGQNKYGVVCRWGECDLASCRRDPVERVVEVAGGNFVLSQASSLDPVLITGTLQVLWRATVLHFTVLYCSD